MRRMVSVWLPYLSTDRLSKTVGSGRDEPLAVMENGAHRRLVALNRAAERVGLRPGMSVADAQAIRPSLKLMPHEPAEEEALLRRLAEWCVTYSPFAAPDNWRETINGAGLWIDITGCAHLWGGEAALLGDLLHRLERLGFFARAAVADCKGAAWAWARYGAGGVLEPETQRRQLAALPVSALRLHPEAVTGLTRLGLRQIGDLYNLPRAPLAARFGGAVAHRLDQALGRVDEPLSPLRAPDALQIQRRFATPIGRREDVDAAIALLLPPLLDRLAQRQLGVRWLTLDLFRTDASCLNLSIGTSRASRDQTALLRLLALKMEGLELGFGIESLMLSATATAPMPAEQSDMTAPSTPESVAQLIDSLGNRFGFSRLHSVTPGDSHLPERAVRHRAAGSESLPQNWPAVKRPPILLSHPEALAVTAPLPDAPPLLFRWRQSLHRVRAAEGPERLAGEWWRENQPARDYYLVEDQAGDRFWLYRLGLPGEFNPARWFLHGLFA